VAEAYLEVGFEAAEPMTVYQDSGVEDSFEECHR
jgi:hypothetical protein